MLASVPAAVMVLAIPGEVPLGGGQGDQKVKLLRVSSLEEANFETRRQGLSERKKPAGVVELRLRCQTSTPRVASQAGLSHSGGLAYPITSLFRVPHVIGHHAVTHHSHPESKSLRRTSEFCTFSVKISASPWIFIHAEGRRIHFSELFSVAIASSKKLVNALFQRD